PGVRHHRHLRHHPVLDRPRPALQHRRGWLPDAALRLPDGAGDHRHDPRAARGAEFPPGDDDLGRRLDRVLHPAAIGDDPSPGAPRARRGETLLVVVEAEARSHTGRCVRLTRRLQLVELQQRTLMTHAPRAFEEESPTWAGLSSEALVSGMRSYD